MPAVSEAQRRKLFATKGAAWVKKHGFDNKGKLPERVGDTKRKAANARAAARRVKKKPRVGYAE